MGADAFLGGATARLFALCSAVLGLKLLLLSAYAALVARRVREGRREVTEEGAGLGEGNPLQQRTASACREDLEGFVLFFGSGLLFVLCRGENVLAGRLMFPTFTIASIFNSWCVLAELQRWRTVNRFIGGIVLTVMIASVLLAVVRAG